MLKKNLTIIACCLLFSVPAMAEDLGCSNDFGECKISEFSEGCVCNDGNASDGGVVVDGDVEGSEVTKERCEQLLAQMCPAFEDCKSTKGMCRVYENGESSCTCADGSGNGSGSTDGSDGETPVAEDPVDGDAVSSAADDLESPVNFKDGTQSCEEMLTEECPNDPPDPEEECAEDAYEACNGIANWVMECNDGNELWPYQLIACCDDYDEAVQEQWECFKDKNCEEGENECNWDNIGEDGSVNTADGDVADDGDGKDLNGESESSDDGDSNDCNHTGSPAGFVLLLIALLMACRKRVFNL